MRVLVLNSGSTSLKFGLFDAAGEGVAHGDLDWAHGDRGRARLRVRNAGGGERAASVPVADDLTAARRAVESLLEIAGAGQAAPDLIRAVGHRVVHGGEDFRESTRITPALKQALARLGRLAPLHNPPALAMIGAIEELLPGTPQVAVFDTAFYSALPLEARLYPVPYSWYEKWGIRRFGFHGLSHAWCEERGAEILSGRPRPLRLVSCHLGGGCSATAIVDGAPVATTMGFSPLEGLMMATRPGSLDPGILLHVQREHGLSLEQIDAELNHASGLAGISGVSGDLTAIEAAAAAGDRRAEVAFIMFADRVRGAIGGLATAMGGLDAIIFTDRIGEGSPALRAAVCGPLEFLGVRLDRDLNQSAVPDADIATGDSAVRLLVLRTREEKVVARETWRVLGTS